MIPTTDKSEKKSITSLNTKESIKDKYKKAIEAIDLNGKYQKVLFVILIMLHFTSCLILTAFPLEKEIPDYECINKVESQENPEEDTKYLDQSKFTIIRNEECIKKYCIDKKENKETHVEMFFMVVDKSSMRNFITMFDLICDIEEYSGNFTRAIFIGRIVGTLICSYISDAYGRKPVFNLILVCMIISNFGFLFVLNKNWYLIFGILSNIAKYANSLAYIAAVEIMSLYLYSHLSSIMGLFFSLCGLFNLAIISIFRDWIVLILAHTVINLITCALSLKYFYESALYLLDIKDYSNLDKVLIQVSSINGTQNNLKQILNSIKLDLQENNDTIKTDNKLAKGFFESIVGPYFQLYKRRKDFIIVMKLFIPFIANFLVYFGQLLYVDKLPGGIKSNTCIILVAECLTPLLNGYLLQNFGRKKILITFYSLCILCSLVLILEDGILLSKIIIFLNAFCISVAINSIYIFSAENFDSSIKCSANGLLIIIGNIAMVFSDFFVNLFPKPFYVFAISLLFGILCVISLPETFKKKT